MAQDKKAVLAACDSATRTETPSVHPGQGQGGACPQTVKPLDLYKQLNRLLERARRAADKTAREHSYTHPDARMSARNFAAYLATRQEDLRELQRELHRHGLSSLGRMDTHALSSLEAVCGILASLIGWGEHPGPFETLDYDRSEDILDRRTAALLGPGTPSRSARIMVTLPTEAASHLELLRDLLAAGMDVMRVNCAHDGPAVWQGMINNAQQAAGELGKSCIVLFDLPGPKLRTGSIERGAGVVRWHAFKNDYGEIIEPARIWLSGGAAEPAFAHAVLPASADFVAQLQAGDEIHFRDHQDRTRWISVAEVGPGGAWCEGARGAFMVAGIQLDARRNGRSLPIAGAVDALPPIPREIRLAPGDLLILTDSNLPGRPRLSARGAKPAEPAQIGCSLAQVLSDVRSGERIFFDDGKIAGVVEHVAKDRVAVRIQWTRGGSAKLLEDKGINVPDTHLAVPTLSATDLEALDFISLHREQVDVVGLSFVRSASDVAVLYDELDRRGMQNHGVLLKIETRLGFQNLPGIINCALRRNRVGIMIARGDLGVEVGFERMAELQEEIASLCAAAHLPVVWATQVLESLAKKGMPSRAEVSDVVLAARTQCVMLNKGPHVVAAVLFLADVLERMEGHQDKHFRLLRALGVAGNGHLDTA